MQKGIYQTKEGTYLFLTGEEDFHGFFAERYNGTIKYLSAKEIDELEPIFATHGSPQVSNLRAWIQEKKKEANWLEDKLNEVISLSQP